METLKKLEEGRSRAEQILNQAYADVNRQHASLEETEFHRLKIQFDIIHFQAFSAMISILKAEPHTFARKVALKEILHMIYEYKGTVTQHHIWRLCQLGEYKGAYDTVTRLRELVRDFRDEFKSLDEYKTLRDKATGHYDQDISVQIAAIERIDEDAALAHALAFAEFQGRFAVLLREIGRATPGT